MDGTRIWFTRIVAPLLFLAAVVILVVVVQRALDTSSSPASSPAGANVAVTTDLSETETAQESKKYYRVKTGDTLEAIAAKFDTSVEVLMDLNPKVDPLALEPGQRIRVA